MKINELKHVPVGYVNTPLEYMPALTKKLGKGKLYIKRDDMTGLALGGNKARKLDYIVKYALDNGYTALMTFGGNQTNHGRLTVAAAIRYGLKPILILKGSKPEYMVRQCTAGPAYGSGHLLRGYLCSRRLAGGRAECGKEEVRGRMC